MHERRLGTNGPEIPVVGFGGWPIGGGMGTVDEETAVRTVREAIEQGITLIDTAEAYRTSESRIGKALKGIDRERYVLATNNFREKGKLKHIGVSNFRVEHMERALKVAPIVSNQINYNMFLRTPEKALIPFCSKHGVGIMVHSTLAKGFLAGKYSRSHRFASDDERSEFAQYKGETFNRYIDAVDELKAVAVDKEWTLIELAIAWVLRNREVTTALIGIKNPGQIEAPRKAGDRTLTAEDLARIEEILSRHNLEKLAPFEAQIV